MSFLFHPAIKNVYRTLSSLLRAAVMLLLSVSSTGRAAAQEGRTVQYPSYTEQDVKDVRQLIHKGTGLRWNYPDSARMYYREAEQLCREKGLASGRGLALAHLGLAATENGESEEAFEYYRQAMPYCLQPGPFRKALPILYLHMGVSWYYKGDYTKANECFYKALSLLKHNLPEDQNTIASVHNNLSSIQLLLLDPRKALAHATLAEQISRMRSDYPLLASALINKGCAYRNMQEQDSAMQCFVACLEVSRSRELHSMTEAALTNIGIMKMNQEDFRGALKYLDEVMQLSKTTNPYYGKVVPGYYAGYALFRLGAYDAAEKKLRMSIAMADQTGVVDKKDRAYAALASLYEATGNYRRSLKYYRLYQQLRDSLTNVEKIKAMGELELKYNTARKDQELVRKELKIALQQKRLARTNIAIGAILVLIIILVAIYRYKRKIRLRDREIDRLKAMMTGEEKERGRISRELHDGIGGMLTGIKMNLKTIQKQSDQAAQSGDLEQIMNMLHQMGTEIHKTAYNLMPEILLRHSLPEALELYIAQQEGDGKLRVSLHCQGGLNDLEKKLELSLYRIIQELVQNTVKYARAKTADIQLRREGDMLYVSVEDDGIGFERGEGEGLGLQNIETRVRTLNGYFSIESATGMGTTAYIELDLRKIRYSDL